jgi:hypothetical protein
MNVEGGGLGVAGKIVFRTSPIELRSEPSLKEKMMLATH